MHYPAPVTLRIWGGGAAVARGPPARVGSLNNKTPEARANPIDFVISGWHWSTIDL